MNIVENVSPEQLLLEMPELVDATDFRMINPEVNLKLAERLINAKKIIIDENDDMVLFRTGDQKGNIAMYDKLTKMIVYWVRFVAKKHSVIGKTVAQVALWRNIDDVKTKNITEYVFFDYLLSEWGAVISDSQQTEDGQRFWRRMMGVAVSKGHKVGMFDMLSKNVDWYDGSKPYPAWISSHLTAWGKEHKHQGYRFVIME